MPESSIRTQQLHGWLARIRAGDLSARDELLRSVCRRLEELTHQMLRRFPNVRRWADTDDVLQNALLRLLRSLEGIEPASMRDFHSLAAVHIRRELLDLARYYGRREGAGLHPGDPKAADDSPASAGEPPGPREDSSELEKWCRFHQEVEHLPVEEREVVSLIYYHGWTQVEVAELLQITDRTVRRRWEAALVKLHRLLKEEPPAEA